MGVFPVRLSQQTLSAATAPVASARLALDPRRGAPCSTISPMPAGRPRSTRIALGLAVCRQSCHACPSRGRAAADHVHAGDGGAVDDARRSRARGVRATAGRRSASPGPAGGAGRSPSLRRPSCCWCSTSSCGRPPYGDYQPTRRRAVRSPAIVISTFARPPDRHRCGARRGDRLARLHAAAPDVAWRRAGDAHRRVLPRRLAHAGHPSDALLPRRRQPSDRRAAVPRHAQLGRRLLRLSAHRHRQRLAGGHRPRRPQRRVGRFLPSAPRARRRR